MRRREFIAVLGAAAAWPLTARAQQAATPVIGFLGSDSPDLYADRLRAFRQGLKETGYAEGQNLGIEYRWAEGHNDRLPALVADLVRRELAVIVTSTTPSVLAAKEATTTTPIVFFVAGDPVALGLVASLNRPGANLTGTTTLTLDVGSKWLELLHELVPTAKTFALLINPTSPTLAEAQAKDLRQRATALGCKYTCWRQVPTPTSTRLLQDWCSFGRVGSQSPLIHSSSRAANSSPHWPVAMPCPRSSDFGSSPRPAADELRS
jgi:putative ABC transport system substrate-binding protein